MTAAHYTPPCLRRTAIRPFAALAAVILLSACAGGARLPDIQNYAAHPDYPAFAERMVTQHGFDRATLDAWFGQAQRQQSILDAIARPAEAKPWHDYRPIFLTEARIQGGVTFWNTHADLLQRAAQAYGVDPAMIIAILGIETFYGGNTGRYRVLDALATLGFDYPPRSAFFLGELEEYLLLSREEHVDPLTTQGSYAGAMGAGQFIPSSYRAYAVDFDGDGQRNLWNSWPDIIGSVAHYFARHHWEKGGLIAVPAALPAGKTLDYPPGMQEVSVKDLRAAGLVFSEGIPENARTWLIVLETDDELDYWVGLNNFYVITRYNRSPLYAMAAYQLSTAIRQARDGHAGPF